MQARSLEDTSSRCQSRYSCKRLIASILLQGRFIPSRELGVVVAVVRELFPSLASLMAVQHIPGRDINQSLSTISRNEQPLAVQ